MNIINIKCLKMFNKLLINKRILSHILRENTLYYNSQNRSLFTTINLKSSLTSIDLTTRKAMTKYIRLCLPIRPNIALDWNVLRHELQLRFNLNAKDFNGIVIPIVSHSDKTHINTLISLHKHLRPTIDCETNPLIISYHFLLLNKIIQNCSHFSDISNRELSEKLLTKLFFSSNDELEAGVVIRIVVIVHNSLISLANSSPFNCIFAINLWKTVLNIVFKDENSWRPFVFKADTTTTQLIDSALQKSLITEAIELTKFSHQLTGFKLSQNNLSIWLTTLLRNNSIEDNIEFFETIKLTDSKIGIKYLREIQLLFHRMGYESKIETYNNHLEVVEMWSKSANN